MKKHVFSQMRSFLVAVVLGCILSASNLCFAIPDGDLTGDGVVTIDDALRALRISVQLVTPNSQDSAQGDVAPQFGGLPAPDGNITIADALCILRKVVGLVSWPSDFSALLSGDQQTPPVTTAATAIGTVSVDPVTKLIRGSIVTSGIIGTVGFAAFLHDGDTGVAGPPIDILLVGGPTVWKIVDNNIIAITLTDAQLARLVAGGLYFEVRSAAFPNGEIRGQINQQVRFASLSGANEVQANGSTASATAVLAMNPITREVAGYIKTTGIAGTLAHIHEGAAGVAGPVAVPLLETPVGSGIWTIPAGSALTAAQAALFNIGSLYYNVQSAAFPDGEIRGQIVPTTLAVGQAVRLDGGQEVPPVTTAAFGTGAAVLNTVTREVRGDVVTTGVAGTAAQFHVTGAVGLSPAIDVPMTETAPGSGAWFIPDTAPTLTPDQALGFITSYYNVLSAANPTGEIRGPIHIFPSFKTGGGIATAAPL